MGMFTSGMNLQTLTVACVFCQSTSQRQCQLDGQTDGQTDRRRDRQRGGQRVREGGRETGIYLAMLPIFRLVYLIVSPSTC